MSKSYAFATISLDNMAGGLERNIIRVANRLSKEGNKVALITFDWETANSFYPIEEEVSWFKVATSRPHQPVSFINRLKLILKIRRALKEMNTSVIICFHHGILARFLLASIFLRVGVVASERNSLTIYDHIKRSKWNLNFLLLAFVKRITVQFETYRKTYPPIWRRKIDVIPNPVYPSNQFANPGERNKDGKYSILTVGRLCTQKNYVSLLKAFAQLEREFPDWELIIIGDGSDQILLHELADKLKINDKVKFVPATDEIFRYYTQAHIFCLPSQWEGFPNSLAEAQAHGLPAVGFKGCAGVSDLIDHERNGLLAQGNGNVESLKEMLQLLMAAPDKRIEFGNIAVQSIQQYAPENIYPLWKKTISKVVDH